MFHFIADFSVFCLISSFHRTFMFSVFKNRDFQYYDVCFRDSLFIGKISISSCCSAGKETKKLLASVSTSASREWLLVEQKRFELSTYTMRTYRSSQLSYCPVLFGMSLI